MQKRILTVVLLMAVMAVGCGRQEKQEQETEETVSFTSMEEEPDLSYEVPVSTPGILVNQLGYLTDSAKVAVFKGNELPKVVMLTGDSADVAKSVRDSLGLDDVVWECLPEEKLSIVERIGSENRTCMVGDGVNDAPSLRRSDVGIAMGAMGSDMAIDAADIVMTDDDLSKIPAIIRMSRRTLVTIKAGIAFSLTLNTIAMIMAAMGLIGPVTGALVHNIGSVMVILGAAMLLRFDCWGGDGNEKDIGNPVPT